jgi:hypothetical protein
MIMAQDSLSSKMPDRASKDCEFPMAAVAYFGPDDQTATKVVAAIINEDRSILKSEKWLIADEDIRYNEPINQEIANFIGKFDVCRAVIAEGILGCPHEPGIDYPAGEDCPYCPFWSEKET